MRRVLVIALTASAAIGAGLVLAVLDRTTEANRGGEGRVGARSSVSVVPDAGPSLKLKPGSRKLVGELALRGKNLRLETAETWDGAECLLQTEAQGGGASQCFESGLFGLSRIAFSVSSDGGPDVFRSLYVLGVAAPGVASVMLTRTDGSVVRVDLDRTRAFVIESSVEDLAANVLPARLEAFGPSGKRVDSVAIPALR
jgi:hypothetical protein